MAQDKKIEEDHTEIQNMKQYIQNLMDRYVETKTEKDKQIKKLEAELASHRADGSSPSSPPPTSDHTPSTSKADTTKPTSDEADPGS